MVSGAVSTRVPIAIREMVDSDRSLVLSSWVQTFAESRFAAPLDPKIYFFEQGKLVERLVRDATVQVACNPLSPGQIYGWACGEVWGSEDTAGAVIHFVYVKSPFRRMGIARELLAPFLQSGTVFYSHLPRSRRPSGKGEGSDVPLAQRLAPGASYNPYLAFPR